MKGTSLALVAYLIASNAFGHHSNAEFSGTGVVEMTGEVVAVQWRNPHVRITLRAAAEDGGTQIWEMESQDLNSLDRAGIPRDLVQVGQIVTVAGNPSSRRSNGFRLTNLLLPDDTEVLMVLSREPRWDGTVLGDRDAPRGRADEFVAPGDRIAVFDNDGTLWPENPMPFQLAYALDELKRRAGRGRFSDRGPDTDEPFRPGGPGPDGPGPDGPGFGGRH